MAEAKSAPVAREAARVPKWRECSRAAPRNRPAYSRHRNGRRGPGDWSQGEEEGAHFAGEGGAVLRRIEFQQQIIHSQHDSSLLQTQPGGGGAAQRTQAIHIRGQAAAPGRCEPVGLFVAGRIVRLEALNQSLFEQRRRRAP